jgi:hypothetical protein
VVDVREARIASALAVRRNRDEAGQEGAVVAVALDEGVDGVAVGGDRPERD